MAHLARVISLRPAIQRLPVMFLDSIYARREWAEVRRVGYPLDCSQFRPEFAL